MTEPFDSRANLWPYMTGQLAFLMESQKAKTATNMLEPALANSIRQWVQYGNDGFNRDLLLTIAEALDNPAAPLRLILKTEKRGPRDNPVKRMTDRYYSAEIAHAVWSDWKNHGELEASLREISSRFGISRSQIFQRIKACAIDEAQKRVAFAATPEQEEYLRNLHKIDPKSFPVVGEGTESNSFSKWLDRYLPDNEKIPE